MKPTPELNPSSPMRRVVLRAIAACGVAAALPSLALAGSYEEFLRAVKVDNVDTVKSLLRRGLNPNLVEPERGESALMMAVRDDAMRVFNVLVNLPNIDLNARAHNGDSALMLAAYKGNKEAFETLLAKGADVNQTGWTALHYAASTGNNAFVQRLLEEHAYIDAEAPNGTTPIMMAARAGHILTVKLLLDEGADVTLKNSQGKTALDMAAMHGHKDIVEGLTHRLKKAGKL